MSTENGIAVKEVHSFYPKEASVSRPSQLDTFVCQKVFTFLGSPGLCCSTMALLKVDVVEHFLLLDVLSGRTHTCKLVLDIMKLFFKLREKVLGSDLSVGSQSMWRLYSRN